MEKGRESGVEKSKYFPSNVFLFVCVSNPNDKEIKFEYLYDDRGPPITDRYTSIKETKWIPKWDYYGLQNFHVLYESLSFIELQTYAAQGQVKLQRVNSHITLTVDCKNAWFPIMLQHRYSLSTTKPLLFQLKVMILFFPPNTHRKCPGRYNLAG